MARFKRHLLVLGALVLLLALPVGCGGDDQAEPTAASDTQPPTALINQPPNQALIEAGQAVQIEVVASDDQAVSRIELYIDNSLVESRVTPGGSSLTTMREVFAWSASIVGQHTLQARVYDVMGQMGASPIVAVNVQLPGAPINPTEMPTAPSGPAETPVPVEPSPVPASPTPEQPLVTANTNANVRSGPGTNYPVLGALQEGGSAIVTGRNTDNSWWQIGFQGGTAWIANLIVTANAQAYNVPVASAPPPPATNTPVPPTATPTPAATSTPATGLRADSTNLAAGQCTTLRWDFSGIKALYISFGAGYDKEGVPGTGTRQVCPSVTTTYEATVVKPDNSQEQRQLTINVSGGGCGDPVIQRFVSTTYDVAANKPFSIFWDVECAKTVRFVRVGGGEEAVGGHGSKEVTISSNTVFQLKVEKNNGGFVYASFTVRIK